MRAHLKLITKNFKMRLWTLYHLKKNGFKKEELVKVYESMIRPVAEYCSVAFDSFITQADSDELERVQSQALKIIFGFSHSYRSLLDMSGLIKLYERRSNAFKKCMLS